jgi:hypothetical protein
MNANTEIAWTGLGKWLSFLSAAVLILVAMPFVLDRAGGVRAGWNIFLGLLLFGVTASGNRRAPLLALALAILMVVRVIVAIALGSDAFVDIAPALLLCVTTGLAAYDLRKQANPA